MSEITVEIDLVRMLLGADEHEFTEAIEDGGERLLSRMLKALLPFHVEEVADAFVANTTDAAKDVLDLGGEEDLTADAKSWRAMESRCREIADALERAQPLAASEPR